MSRDYAKKGGSSKKSKKGNMAIWIILLLGFTMFVSALIFIKDYRNEKNKFEQKISSAKKTISKKISTAKFDFYDTSPKKKNVALKKAYELEITIVDNYDSADHLKAKLTLLGFSVNIYPILKKGTQKYRITTGPYENKDKALANQKRLKRNKINSELKKTK